MLYLKKYISHSSKIKNNCGFKYRSYIVICETINVITEGLLEEYIAYMKAMPYLKEKSICALIEKNNNGYIRYTMHPSDTHLLVSNYIKGYEIDYTSITNAIRHINDITKYTIIVNTRK